MQKQNRGCSKVALTRWFCQCIFAVLFFFPVHLFAQEAPDDVNKQLKEQREQDSLKHLLETGQADTIHYTYETIGGINLENQTAFSRIQVRPRIDLVSNELGTKSWGVVWMLVGITILLVGFCHLLIFRYVYRGKLHYIPIYLILYFLGGSGIYHILSSIYSNLDEISIRKYGKEEIATFESEGSWEHHKFRSRHYRSSHTDYVLRYSFVFTGANGVRMRVSQDNATFDKDDYQSETDKAFVKVRYDSATRKLAVDDERYFIYNVCQILFMCFLLLLILLFSYGKFNKQLSIAKQKLLDYLDKTPRKKITIEPAQSSSIIDMPLIVYTSWKFTSKHYDSMDEFIRDVKHSEQQQNFPSNSGLRPYRVIIERPDFIITVFDQDITGENDLRIEITSDNGVNITEGELLFKLHNQMIPYVGRLVVDILEEIDFFDKPKEDGPIECTLMFEYIEETERNEHSYS